MDYLVPAWHARLGDWSFGSPNYGFDDTVSITKLLGQGQQNPGLLVVDYQPQLSTRLAQSALAPRKIFSVFDYIQGIEHVENQTVDFYDLNLPPKLFFEFTPFHLIVRNGAKLFANVFFDMEDKIVNVDYFHDDRHYRTLIFDSRGFVSRVEHYNEDNNQLVGIDFLDQSGNWRIKYDPNTDGVTVNSTFQNYFVKSHYDHLNDLIREVVQKQFLDRLHHQDRLIVAVDNDSRIDQTIYSQRPVIYEISRWHAFDQALPQLKDVENLKLVSDTQFTAAKAQEILGRKTAITEIPLYQAMFKLGHSQQLKGQRIYLLIDNTDIDQLQRMAEVIVSYLLTNPRELSLYLLTFGQGGDKAHQIVQTLLERHQGQFIIKNQALDAKHQRQNAADNENAMLNQPHPGLPHKKKKKVIPELTIKNAQLYSSADILKGLDKARIMIDWGDHPNDFLQMAVVSLGIPTLQRIPTEEIIDGYNGKICQDLLDLREGLHYYLDGLKNWNQSLTNDVQILNEHAADKLIAQWDSVWKKDSESHK